MRLTNLLPGRVGVIRRYATDDPPARLLELGLVPETTVEMVRRAPLGDPLYLKVDGGALCIRQRDAKLICVDEA
jgi:ferrous iron transport protein A